MTHGIVLLAEGDTILVVVRTILDHTTNVNQVLREGQIARIARSAVHLHHTHVVRRADGVTCQLGRGGLVEMAEEVGRLDCRLEERTLTRSAVVRNTGHHQVTEVIGLEVQTVGEGSLLVGTTHLRTDSLLLMAVGMGIDTTVALVDNDRRMNIAILTLCLDHAGDKVIHNLVQLGILGHGIDRSHTLQPLVHIAIVERRTVMMPLTLTGSNLEVTQTVRKVGIAPNIPHVLHRGVAVHIEAFAPEAARPTYSSEGHIGHL